MNFISSRHYICIFVSLGKYFTERKRKREREREEILCVWVNVWCITERDSEREEECVYQRNTNWHKCNNQFTLNFVSIYPLLFSDFLVPHSFHLSLHFQSVPFLFWVFLCSYIFSTFICFYRSTKSFCSFIFAVNCLLDEVEYPNLRMCVCLFVRLCVCRQPH